jgi:hypothetical protein
MPIEAETGQCGEGHAGTDTSGVVCDVGDVRWVA